MAAATLSLPNLSLHALGRNLFLIISLNVIKPRSLLLESTTGNFSILLDLSIFSALSKSFISVVTRFVDVF